ncbi:unnamed protein product [Hymenolepis diminuta]|uniref:Uncharacterized protein n=1 Tax=Hymenolepis diminuta TaxID=6216 RepID=A0A564XY04_HYMDI|nr:unnamed protein product [Hymenolepis diminuta]
MWSLFAACGFCCFYIFPVLISGYISTPETVIDSILVDIAPYIIGQGDESATVLSVENVVRCGPILIDEIVLSPSVTYVLSACIAMDNLKVRVKYVRQQFS